MIKQKLKLTKDLILNTKFSTDILGYSAKEVDLMLDKIIIDYKTFENIILDLTIDNNNKRKEILNKKEKIEKLMLEIMKLKEIINIIKNNNKEN